MFTGKDTLQKHNLICRTEIVSRGGTSDNCETCGKTFTQKRYLEQHKRTHVVQKKMVQYDCKFCDKVFASNQSLGKHVSKHHPNPRRVEDAAIGFMVLDSSP